MKILIAYASSEGQTRKIMQHGADRIADAGHAVDCSVFPTRTISTSAASTV